MSKQTISNVKLGVFVVAGLFFLILLLYVIGKNKNLFGSTFRLRAHFGNVQGLTEGNNVRYAGIQVGTVKEVNIMNDTLIEVEMLIETRMKEFIRKNAVVTIGSDGLMGDRVLNISPSSGGPAALVTENDILPVRKTMEMDNMMQTLGKTNNDVAVIADQLKSIAVRINNSAPVWEILNDKSLPQHLRSSLENVRTATGKASQLITDLQSVVTDVKDGKGSLGAILTDSSFAVNLQSAIGKINKVGDDADSLALAVKSLTQGVQHDIDKGKGAANVLLKDTLLAQSLQQSVQNIQEGTESLNEVLEALKHNFLLRGYFRKREKQREKELKKQPAQ